MTHSFTDENPGETVAFYIPIDKNLKSKSQFVVIRDLTDLPPDVICGRLLLFWDWVDTEARQHPDKPDCGLIPKCTIKSVSREAGGDAKFWEAVQASGWVTFADEGIVIPGFHERFSQEFKQRIVNAKSKREQRQALKSAGYDIDEPAAAPKASSRRSDLYREEESVFKDLTPQLLQDVNYLMSWVTIAASKPNAVVVDDDYHRARTIAAARYCMQANVKKPVGLFVKMHVSRQWTKLDPQYWEYGKSQFVQWSGKSQRKTGHPDLDRRKVDDDEPMGIGELTEKLLTRGRN